MMSQSPMQQQEQGIDTEQSLKRRLRVLVVDEELPYPATTGKRIRTLNLLRHLAADHDITFLCHRNSDPREFGDAKRFFDKLGIQKKFLSRPMPQQTTLLPKWRLAADLFRNLFSPYPYLVQKNMCGELRDAVQDAISRREFDIVHFEWTPYAAAMPVTSDVPWIVDAHNVESLIWRRYEENERKRLKRWYIGIQRAKLERFERDVFTNATTTITVSAEDAELAAAEFDARNIVVVDNGVDTEFFNTTSRERDPNTLLFLGSLDWRPNLDGVDLFIDRVFPKIRAEVPSAKLLVVGRKPPSWFVHKLAACDGATLCADVPDVRPFLSSAGIMVVPLRIGGGSRLKILEAAVSGLPVVSTRVGAEGLHLEPGRHYQATDSIETMAMPVLEIMRDMRAALKMAANARQRALELYDWRVIAERLNRVWQDVVWNSREGVLTRRT